MTTIFRIPSSISSPITPLFLSNNTNPLKRSNLSPQNPIKIKSLISNCIKFDCKGIKTNPIGVSLTDFSTILPSGEGVGAVWTRVSPLAELNPNGTSVTCRLSKLVCEFRSLPEPIDRVRRLLEYASMLGPTELTRSELNRVPGCAARVWIDVEMDEFGRVWFRADSDSEITKGFCSCLIFLLDGSFPLDILKVKAEDLADMNVGLPVRSRVNSWHNVLVYMQERTKSLIA